MDTESVPLSLLFILIALVLVAANAFFVAAEFAIVKVRRTRLQELAEKGESTRAKLALECVDSMDEYLSATQLGITLVSLGLGWIGEESFFSLFVHVFGIYATLNPEVFHFIGAAFSFLIITMLHVVLGELVPKSMAIQRAEQISLYIAYPLSLFYRISRPMIVLFTRLANIVLKFFGFHGPQDEPLTPAELKIVMNDSQNEGVITEGEAQIIHRALEFADKSVKHIMIPTNRVQYISLNRTFEENCETILSRMYTRFPVCDPDMQNVIGVVNMKDLRFRTETTNDLFVELMRPVVYVDPETEEDKLLKIFSDKRAHLTIVRDKTDARTLGIVTLEDVLEQLVGEIVDEHGN